MKTEPEGVSSSPSLDSSPLPLLFSSSYLPAYSTMSPLLLCSPSLLSHPTTIILFLHSPLPTLAVFQQLICEFQHALVIPSSVHPIIGLSLLTDSKTVVLQRVLELMRLEWSVLPTLPTSEINSMLVTALHLLGTQWCTFKETQSSMNT